jgi:uncharacterized membrane protein
MGAVGILTVIVFFVIMIVVSIKEHKRYMKYTNIKREEQKIREIIKEVRAKGKYYVITEKDIENW